MCSMKRLLRWALLPVGIGLELAAAPTAQWTAGDRVRSSQSRGRGRVQMRRESLFPFVPAVLAAVANIVATAVVRSSQPEKPGRFVVFQVVMFGAALSAAIPNKWVRFVGFVLVLAGMTITGFSVGTLYVPDVPCCRVANGERCAAIGTVRAGAGKMRTAADEAR
jgi:hypothetical protein